MIDEKRIGPERGGPSPSLRDGLAYLSLVILTGLAFANSLGGAFVYDDVKQIVANHLIQEPGRLGEALLSDVWAFKGEREEAWSNYWRPTFVLWLAGNAALFGVEAATGWHLTLILLHALVSCLAFRLLRRLGIGFSLALVAAGLFAVHPVHVESVAWISGAPDPLMSAFFLGALLLALGNRQGPSPWLTLASLGLFALSLGAKEVAVVLPLVLFFLRWERTSVDAGGVAAHRAALAVVPYLALVALFLVSRRAVLGWIEIETPWHRSLWEILLTVPSLVIFYLRQCFFPLWLGPSYPLRAVAPDALGLGSFWMPVLLLAASVWLWLWACRRWRGVAAGGLLFALPLLPALNINAFIQEQLVHDRYLYLPLLGFLLALVSFGSGKARAGRRGAAVAGLAVIALLGAQTVRYNRAWASEMTLWQWGVKSDSGSAFNLSQLGYALLAEGRRAEALEAFDKALDIKPVTAALLARAGIARESGRLRDAEADLRRVQRSQPANPLSYEGLALVYQQAGELEQAERILTLGRLRIPHHRCAFSSNLGVVRYLAGRKGAALQALRSVPPLVASDRSIACRLGLFHLGNLRRELGDEAGAVEAHQLFLELTGGSRDQRIAAARDKLLGAGEPAKTP